MIIRSLHIIETGANYVFPIHDDTPNKLLSGVVYLKPENNSGTIFYKDKKDTSNKEIVEWKPNRAVFFFQGQRDQPGTPTKEMVNPIE